MDENKKLDGGFKLFNLGDSFTKTIQSTKSSEYNLIKSYENMDAMSKQYHKSYDIHLTNLAKLDEYANFKGMENLFKKVIMKNNFKNGKIDKSTPILFRNYLIEEETSPSAFRKEHIMRQIYYVLEKYFPGRIDMFIKHMNLDIGKHDFILHITTIENIKISNTISHNGYVINFLETKSILNTIFSTIKKHLRRSSSIIKFNSNNNLNNSSDSNESNNSSTYIRKKNKKHTKNSIFSNGNNSRGTQIKSKTKIKSKSVLQSTPRSPANISLLRKSKSKTRLASIKKSNENESKQQQLDLFLTPSQRKKLRAPVVAPTVEIPKVIDPE